MTTLDEVKAGALALAADLYGFTQTGTGAVARSVNTKLRETVTLKDFGAVGDGVANDTAAMQAALNSGAKRIRVTNGVYAYTSLTVPDGVTLDGDNKLDCILKITSATADGIIPGHGVSFVEIGFTSAVTRTAGSYIKTASNDTLVERCIFDSYFIGFSGAGVSNAALCVRPQVRNCLFRNPAIGTGSGAILFLNYSNAMADGIVASGPTSGQQPDFGLKIVSGDTAFVSNSNLTLHGEALLICPGDNQNVYATKITSSVFDSGGAISGGLLAVSGGIRPTGTGNVIETTVTGSWFGLSKGNDGLFVGSFGTGVVDGLHIHATHFDGNAGSGIHIGSNVANWGVYGGSAAGNTLNGLYISAASSHWSVTGLKARPMSQRGPNGQFGINHGVVASDYYNIIGNDTFGNTSGGLFDGGTGTHKNVQYNL